MNEKPHSHQPEITDFGNWWSIRYGDQPRIHPGKPIRWPWDSDARYEAKLAATLHRHIAALAREHDRMSLLAGMNMTPEQRAIGTLDLNRWGSAQLDDKRD